MQDNAMLMRPVEDVLGGSVALSPSKDVPQTMRQFKVHDEVYPLWVECCGCGATIVLDYFQPGDRSGLAMTARLDAWITEHMACLGKLANE